ncbi:unnamed protein product [Somion occarium]|uniref:C-factor n=1 Tax=Somion occarium TaxID=3059160 RepID=A0ABP1CV64_9APHY
MLNTFTWLITGSNRGLGLEMVEQLLQSPTHTVIATCRNPDKATALQDLRTRFLGNLHIVKLEVTDQASIEECVKAVEIALGDRGLDYLLNNAAISEQRDTAFNFNAQGYIDTFYTNVLAPAMITRAFLPLLEKGKRKVILNMSSQLGSMAWRFGAPYATYASCKAALNMMTTKQAAERPDLIVFCMCPGWCKTDLGGEDAPLDPKVTMASLLKFVSSATSEHSGRYWRWTGEELEW